LFVAVAVGAAHVAANQQSRNDCDPEVVRAPGQYAYSQRADRCEGRYQIKKASSVGELAVTSVKFVFDPAKGMPPVRGMGHLKFVPFDGPVDIHVSGEGRDLYRLDTRGQSGRSGTYIWPTSIVEQLEIDPLKLRVLVVPANELIPRFLPAAVVPDPTIMPTRRVAIEIGFAGMLAKSRLSCELRRAGQPALIKKLEPTMLVADPTGSSAYVDFVAPGPGDFEVRFVVEGVPSVLAPFHIAS
jgi:hypothetical protein